jgi:hypothetical protein
LFLFNAGADVLLEEEQKAKHKRSQIGLKLMSLRVTLNY